MLLPTNVIIKKKRNTKKKKTKKMPESVSIRQNTKRMKDFRVGSFMKWFDASSVPEKALASIYDKTKTKTRRIFSYGQIKRTQSRHTTAINAAYNNKQQMKTNDLTNKTDRRRPFISE